MTNSNCVLCKRERKCTFHHLIPKSMHRRKWVRKNYEKKKLQEGIWVCRDCHSAIHRFISCQELAREYSSLVKLTQHEELMKFVDWAGKQRKTRLRTKK